jgi:sulfhydrogenase subunit alpha
MTGKAFTGSIHVEHVTRIEGHGNIILDAKDGKVLSIQWQVPEAPRFFESIVLGREFDELPLIASRICGICSISHTIASLKAVENAMGIEVSGQTISLRKLATHAETIQSHILHLGYLISPDLLGAGSVFPLIKTHKEAVSKVIKLHRLGNEMSDLICGRTTHPVIMAVGGFSRLPKETDLTNLRGTLTTALKLAGELAELVKENAGKLPAFSRETEYISLTSDNEYALYDGLIGSTISGKHKQDEYLSVTNEYIVPHSTAKFAKHERDSYFVGALARFNLNSAMLSPEFGLKAPCYNPFMNNIAQLAETVHCFEDSIRIIDDLLENGIRPENLRDLIRIKEGCGIGIVEAPRGILMHEYTIDKDGKCTKGNFIIPTNQNHANIQKDMEAFAPTLMMKDRKEIELNLEMLVRAYDPCVSCSTHYLNVEFV